jgi:hypothetical protein
MKLGFTPNLIAAALGSLLLVRAPRARAEQDAPLFLDTERPPEIFTAAARPGGHTYIDTMQLESVTHMDISGFQSDSTMSMYTETEVLVTNTASGGQTLDMTTLRITISTETMGMTSSCDSNQKKNLRDPGCDMIMDLVDKSYHVELDSQGHVVDSEEEDSSVIAQVGPSAQVEQMSRVLDVIPPHAIQPMDSWDAAFDLGDLGHFTGIATFLGYRSQDGHECAEILVKGTLHVDTQAFLEKSDMSEMDGVTVSDATLSINLLWDNEWKLTRWSKSTQSFTMEMNDPITYGKKLRLPIEEVITTTSKVKDDF